jgi:hypothetical protein
VNPESRSVWNAFSFLLAVAGVLFLMLFGAARLKELRPVFGARIVIGRGGTQGLAEPESGAMELRRSDGSSIRFGGGSGDLPQWFPSYPGRQAKDVFRMEDGGGNGSVSFALDGGPAATCGTLGAEWQGAGMRVQTLRAASDGCMLLVKSDVRTLLVSIGKSEKGSTLNVTYTKK